MFRVRQERHGLSSPRVFHLVIALFLSSVAFAAEQPAFNPPEFYDHMRDLRAKHLLHERSHRRRPRRVGALHTGVAARGARGGSGRRREGPVGGRAARARARASAAVACEWYATPRP